MAGDHGSPGWGVTTAEISRSGRRARPRTRPMAPAVRARSQRAGPRSPGLGRCRTRDRPRRRRRCRHAVGPASRRPGRRRRRPPGRPARRQSTGRAAASRGRNRRAAGRRNTRPSWARWPSLMPAASSCAVNSASRRADSSLASQNSSLTAKRFAPRSRRQICPIAPRDTGMIAAPGTPQARRQRRSSRLSSCQRGSHPQPTSPHAATASAYLQPGPAQPPCSRRRRVSSSPAGVLLQRRRGQERSCQPDLARSAIPR